MYSCGKSLSVNQCYKMPVCIFASVTVLYSNQLELLLCHICLLLAISARPRKEDQHLLKMYTDEAMKASKYVYKIVWPVYIIMYIAIIQNFCL